MNDQDFAAAIAEAVRPVWPELRIVHGRHKLIYVPHETAWQMMCGDDDATWAAEHWSVAILLHELERMARAFPINANVSGCVENGRVHAAIDRLGELLRAQA